MSLPNMAGLRPTRSTPSAVSATPASPAPIAANGRSRASAASFGSMYASLSRDIGGAIRNGFVQTGKPQLSSQATQWFDAMRMRNADKAEKSAASKATSSAMAADPDRQAFLADIMPHARRAGQALGAAPELIAAHAALESGWGAKPLTNARGETTHNLFGIKATGGWKGASAAATTTEYLGGVATKVVEHFRAYPSYAGAFRDYAALLKNSPRYTAALDAGSDARKFARALKQGGYATDPAYESKLVQVVEQVRKVFR